MSDTEYIRQEVLINGNKYPFIRDVQMHCAPNLPFSFGSYYEPIMIPLEITISCIFPSVKEFYEFNRLFYLDRENSIKVIFGDGNSAEAMVFYKGHNMKVQEDNSIEAEFNLEGKQDDPYDKYDKKYPHICFKCKKKLKFREYKMANLFMDINRLKRLWKDKRIKLYCCECYKWINLK